MKKFSAKTLIALKKWKMLLMTLDEGEHIFKLSRKEQGCLRTTIYRTKYDRPDKDYIYDSCNKGNTLVVSKKRRTET